MDQGMQMIIAMGISLMVVMPIVILLIEEKDRQDKIKLNSGASLYLQEGRDNRSHRIYDLFLRFPFTRGYITKISRRYEILCPGNPRDIANKTMTLTGTAFVLCILEITVIFIIKPNPYNFIAAVYLVFVINNEVINYFISKTEISLLDEMERFISNVSHNYFDKYFIDDSIMRAIDGRMSEDMRVHAKMLFEIVTSDHIRDEVERYNSTVHNKFMKMFLSLCVNVMENNDRDINGQMLLSGNLLNLKREINLEALKLKKLRFVFAGSIFVSVVVCLPITAVQNFGISIAPALETFYRGTVGTIYVAILFLSSMVIYLLINYAKEVKKPVPNNYNYLAKMEKNRYIKAMIENFTDKFYGRMMILRETLKRLGENITPSQLLIKSIIISLVSFVISIGLIFYLHYNNRQIITQNVSDVNNITAASTDEQYELIAEAILRYVDKYKDETVTQEQLLTELTNENIFYNSLINEQAAQEIMSRIIKYQKEIFKWYELLLCFLISMIAFFSPYLMIEYKKKLLKANMEDEVIQFNSIIYMMMFTEHVSVMDILEQMELFSVVFKPTIRECMNEYNSGDIEALTRMKERETYDPFIRLADNLIRCDDIPISKAFNEIAADRENYFDRRRQENDISIQKRADSIQPLAFLPGVLIVIYLIIPVLYVSVNELYALKDLINSSGMY